MLHDEHIKLKQYINRIESLEDEKKEISQQISDIYASAKSTGLDPKVMRQVIKLRKMKDEDLREQEILVETYMNALNSSS